MDWQRNFVFDCLAGRAGLEAPGSVADIEPVLLPAITTTYLLPITKRPPEASRGVSLHALGRCRFAIVLRPQRPVSTGTS